MLELVRTDCDDDRLPISRQVSRCRLCQRRAMPSFCLSLSCASHRDTEIVTLFQKYNEGVLYGSQAHG
jgi:hypothetical protein